jgi:archaeosine-15-forming tRNA-guanine transglycosylase
MHQARRVILVLRWQVAGEHVRRFDDVVIHADEDQIVAIHGSLLAVGTATGIGLGMSVLTM